MAWTYIAESNLTSTSNEVTFSGIGSSFTDLKIIAYVKSVSAGAYISLRLNSDTGTNYSRWTVYNQYSPSTNLTDGGYAYSSISLGMKAAPSTSMYDIDIFQYANSEYKQVRCNFVEGIAVSDMAVGMVTGMWFDTSAVTSVTIRAGASGTMGSGTKIALYGIKAA